MVIWPNSKKRYLIMLTNNIEPFDKLVVMRQLVWSCIFENNKTIGVVLPNYESVKKFKNDLMQVMSEVPNWLLQLKIANTRNVQSANNVSVRMFNTVLGMRGTTLNVVYIADDLNKKQYDEFVVSMIPTLRGGSIISFQNT